MDMVSRRRKVCRRGAAAVEIALVLPVLLLVTFGAIRYGWFFLKLQQITNAARYGARVAIRADAVNQDVLDAISALLGPFGADIIDDGDPVPVTFMVNGVASGDITPATNMGDSITVTITVPAADVDILPMTLFNFEPDGWNLRASVTMAKEGA
jgi:Flp pilus assembly protein TadG